MNYRPLAGMILLCYLSFYGIAQKPDLSQLDYMPIAHLDSMAKVPEFKEVLKNTRILLLGEQTHGEGATFDAKVKLIQYLHEEMGFDMIAFESGLYTNYRAGVIDNTLNPTPSTYYESIFSIWSDTQSFKALLDYVKETRATAHPLQITGFDFQEGLLFKEYFFEDLKALFNKAGHPLRPASIQILEDTFFGDVDYISTRSEDSVKFYTAVQEVFDGFRGVGSTEHANMLQQSFKSYLASIEWAVAIHQNKAYKVQNPRDWQMANNLIFLADQYPDKKIIGWGAAYHFANHIDKYQNTNLTRQYITDMEEENERYDLDSALQGAIPMGKILKTHFGDKLYSLAFSSYQGTYGRVGYEIDTLPTPPGGSVEAAMNDRGYANAFVDFSHKAHGSFYASPLGNLPILAPWQEIFDGLMFVNTSYPPAFSQYAEEKLATRSVKSNVEMTGRVIDATTRRPIPYAHISLANTSKGTVTNNSGYFNLKIDGTSGQANLVLSAMGYMSQQLDVAAVADSKDTLQIELVQNSTLLDEVVISEKPLDAAQIIKKARRSIASNYYQHHYNQEFFYRVQRGMGEAITFNEEAAIYVYDKSGYQPSNRAYKNFYGQILQFRHTTGDPEKHKWDGVGSIWLVFSHDLIFDKDNVLHRTSAYDLELTGITGYQNRVVYEIAFICKRPSAYTTGYGYPAPKASHGKLYIDTENYAILRYEHCIARQDSKPNKASTHRSEANRIQLIQTYRPYNNQYFLHHSKQLMHGRRINIQSQESEAYLQSFDLLSTAIAVDPVTVLGKPIDKLKVGMKIKNDTSFWERHNYVIEDNFGHINNCDSSHHQEE